VSVNRRRGHTVADEVVPDGPVSDPRIPVWILMRSAE
jgi:hypothetical protein